MPLRRNHRILLVNRVSHLGGVERVILALATGLRQHGYETFLACPEAGDLPDAARAAGIAVRPCAFDRMRITADPRDLARYPFAWHAGAAAIERHCRELGIDLIHTHHPVGTLYAMRAARRLRVPLVQHVHEVGPARLAYAAALRLAATACSRFLCVSKAGRALLAEAGLGRRPADIIHNGVDPGFLSGVPSARPPELNGPGPHLGVFGVIEPRKGQHVFLDAAARLAARHPQARFWIVGGLALADKAPYLRHLQELSAAPDLAGRVTFTGHRPDVAGFMSAMDVVVQASIRHESLSMAMIEALFLGCRIVATDVGGTTEIVTDGKTGCIVPPDDAAALAEAMDRMLQPDAARLAAAAAEDAGRFATQPFLARVARSFDDVIRAPREATP